MKNKKNSTFTIFCAESFDLSGFKNLIKKRYLVFLTKLSYPSGEEKKGR